MKALFASLNHLALTNAIIALVWIGEVFGRVLLTVFGLGAPRIAAQYLSDQGKVKHAIKDNAVVAIGNICLLRGVLSLVGGFNSFKQLFGCDRHGLALAQTQAVFK